MQQYEIRWRHMCALFEEFAYFVEPLEPCRTQTAREFVECASEYLLAFESLCDILNTAEAAVPASLVRALEQFGQLAGSPQTALELMPSITIVESGFADPMLSANSETSGLEPALPVGRPVANSWNRRGRALRLRLVDADHGRPLRRLLLRITLIATSKNNHSAGFHLTNDEGFIVLTRQAIEAAVARNLDDALMDHGGLDALSGRAHIEALDHDGLGAAVQSAARFHPREAAALSMLVSVARNRDIVPFARTLRITLGSRFKTIKARRTVGGTPD